MSFGVSNAAPSHVAPLMVSDLKEEKPKDNDFDRFDRTLPAQLKGISSAEKHALQVSLEKL